MRSRNADATATSHASDREGNLEVDLQDIRRQFPALAAIDDQGRSLVHADAPGGTQAVDRAIDAMVEHLRSGSANQHGAFGISQRTDAMVEKVRGQVGRFLGTQPDGVVFGPNMTSLTLHLSRALTPRLAPGDHIVCTQLDHDANVSPWLLLAERSGAEVRFVPLDPTTGRLSADGLERAVTDRTRLIAFPGASNALGTVVDPAPYVAAARSVGALTFMDAVHLAPHRPLDRVASGVDVVACSPYKFFGPHAGILAAEPSLLAELSPDKLRPAPNVGPERWQTGTASFEAIAGIGGALDHLDEVGLEAIVEHERGLTERFLVGVDALTHVTLHGPGDVTDRTPTFALTVDGWQPPAIAGTFAARGINVWAGHYYAIEPMRALGLLDQGGAVRVGFVHYHGVDDVDRVLEALADLRRLS
jgi:cysteine desulfurase family protein (TIGR01976 family)